MPIPSQSRDSLELASLASSSVAYDGAASDVSSRPSISSSRRLSMVEEEDPLDEGNPAARGRLGRSYSVSSAFDFAGNLFPLSSTAGAGGYAPIGAPTSAGLRSGGGLGGGSLEKLKTLTYLNGLSLIIGLIIGSGIFSSPSQVSARLGSPGAALIVWVVAGILAWTGGASYAELGGAIPLNGGSQVYLAKTFSELAGFLFSWVALLVLKPGSAAIIAIIMGEYFVRAIIGAEAETINPWINKAVALVGIFAVTFLNCVSTRVGTRVNDFLMFLKFVALIGVTVVGIVVAVTGLSFKGPASSEWKSHDWFAGTSSDPSNWAIALYAGLWAYDGWDNVSLLQAITTRGRETNTVTQTDKLRRGRVPQPQQRPPARHPHGHAARHPLVRPRQRVVLSRATPGVHQRVQHRRRHVRVQGLWPPRRARLCAHCQRELLWRPQLVHIHGQSPHLRGRQGGLHP